MGHIHVCEALGIPLHIMFPQPWYYSTRAFPHPMSGLSYNKDDSMLNEKSYDAFEMLLSTSFGRRINTWRRQVLELDEVRGNNGIARAIVQSKVPFSAMWSPSFVPKPKDWPSQCQVVGTFSVKKAQGFGQNQKFDTEPFAELIKWLGQNPDPTQKPVFIGFGSMVIEDTASLATIIKEAAVKADCRIVVQSSWSNFDVNSEPRCTNVGPCPHDWLLPQMCSVIHHGGAGTTAAGLRHGLPTFVCPFFADQHMWGAMVHRAGVGPKPCPVSKLTSDLLVEKLKELRRPDIQSKAHALAKQMAAEDGIKTALQHFLTCLPRNNMLCDVGLIMGEANLARFRINSRHRRTLKVSVEVVALLEQKTARGINRSGSVPQGITEIRRFSLVQLVDSFRSRIEEMQYGIKSARMHAMTMFGLSRVETVAQGCAAGWFGLFYHIFRAPFQIFFRSDDWARSHGAFGCLFGLICSSFYVSWYTCYAVIVWFDRIFVGCSNGCCRTKALFCLDRNSYYRVHSEAWPGLEILTARGNARSKRTQEIKYGLDMTIAAAELFDKARPRHEENQHQHRVVLAKNLIRFLRPNPRSALRLSQGEVDAMKRVLKDADDEDEKPFELSFSMFCHLVHQVISTRPTDVLSARQVKTVTPLHSMDIEQGGGEIRRTKST